MEVEDLIEIEIATREMVAALQREIEDAKANLAPPGQLDGTEGRLSRQDSMLHHEIAKDAHRRRLQRLVELQTALQRMDDGSFGVCAQCGGEISVERLSSHPQTVLCNTCARRE